MDTSYAWLKLLHILVAVLALGTSAGLGIVLEFYAGDPVHGPFMLRVIERMVALVVLPGYILVLGTGLWMASLASLFAARWIEFALGLWRVGLACLCGTLATLRKQRALHDEDPASCARYALASRALGAAFGLVSVAILYLMVIKPQSS